MSKSNVCYRCGLPGHYAPDCPNNGNKGNVAGATRQQAAPQVTKEDYLKMREEDNSTLATIQTVTELSDNNDVAQALYTLLCEMRDRVKKIEENSGNILAIIGRVENMKTLLEAGDIIVKRAETTQQQQAMKKKMQQSTLLKVGVKRTRNLETASEQEEEIEV